MNSYMTPGELGILLELVDYKATKRWHSKRSVLSVIGAFGGGGWISGADVALFSPFPEHTCRVILNQLEQARVILRDGDSGQRPGWVRVNPDWRAWRDSIDGKDGSGIIWGRPGWGKPTNPRRRPVQRFDKAEIASKLARYYEIEAMPVELRFVARSMDARQDPVVARSIRARLAAVNDANVQVDEPEPEPPSRAPKNARQRRHLRAVNDRATTARRSPKKSSNGSDDAKSGSLGGSQRDKQRDTQLRAFLFKRCKPAPNGDRYVVFDLLDQLDALIMRWGHDTVTAAGDALGKGYMVPDFLKMLELSLHSPADAPTVDDTPNPGERAEELRSAIASRLKYIGAIAGADGNEELLESCRAEVDAWQSELDALKLAQEGLA